MVRCRYAIRLAYDGGAFRGFQRQPGLPTVQDALARALAAAGIVAPIVVAARTDAGVHALGQVVSLKAEAGLDVDALRRRLNAALPAEIACLEVAPADPSFHARGSAVSRTYVYLLGTPCPPGLERYCWSLPDDRAFPGAPCRELDLGRLRGELTAAVGRHDFRGFARAGVQKETVKELLRADVSRAVDLPLVAITLEGCGFLRAMVRNLVGAAVTVGLGLSPEGTVAAQLAAPRRYRGVRAPAWGLTLAEVRYPKTPWAQGRPPSPA